MNLTVQVEFFALYICNEINKCVRLCRCGVNEQIN